jgi:uncharacterized protein
VFHQFEHIAITTRGNAPTQISLLSRLHALSIATATTLTLLALPTAYAASFNCKAASAKKFPEKAICTSPDLSSLDDQVDKLHTKWRGALKTQDGVEAARDEQTNWLSIRDKCGCDEVCLIDAYDGRAQELTQAVGETYEFKRPNSGDDYLKSRASKWEKPGRHTVKVLKKDVDVVEVDRSGGFFTAIDVKVSGNRVNFYDVKVIYGNNEEDHLQVRRVVEKGGETGPMKLNLDKYKGRVIKKIELNYQSGSWFRGRARVLIESQHG